MVGTPVEVVKTVINRVELKYGRTTAHLFSRFDPTTDTNLAAHTALAIHRPHSRE
jgi:hypothetical protein